MLIRSACVRHQKTATRVTRKGGGEQQGLIPGKKSSLIVEKKTFLITRNSNYYSRDNKNSDDYFNVPLICCRCLAVAAIFW